MLITLFVVLYQIMQLLGTNANKLWFVYVGDKTSYTSSTHMVSLLLTLSTLAMPWSRVITRIPYLFWGITNTYYTWYYNGTKLLNTLIKCKFPKCGIVPGFYTSGCIACNIFCQVGIIIGLKRIFDCLTNIRILYYSNTIFDIRIFISNQLHCITCRKIFSLT